MIWQTARNNNGRKTVWRSSCFIPPFHGQSHHLFLGVVSYTYNSNKEFQGKNTIRNLTTVWGACNGCLQSTHTQISPLTLDVTTNRCRPHMGYSAAGNTKYIYILKVTNKNKFPTLHTRHTPMTDTLFLRFELHLRGRNVQDGKLLHPLLKRGLPPPVCLWVITPPEVADEVDHSDHLVRACPGMPARHDCRPCVSSPYPDATFN